MNINWHKALISRTVVSVETRALPKVYRFPDCNCATHFFPCDPKSFVFRRIRRHQIHKIPLGVCSFILVDWTVVWNDVWGRRSEVRLSGRYVNYCPFFSPSERGRFKRKTWLTFKARSARSLNKRSPSLAPILCFHPPLYLWLAYTYILVRYVFRLETSK